MLKKLWNNYKVMCKHMNIAMQYEADFYKIHSKGRKND